MIRIKITTGHVRALYIAYLFLLKHVSAAVRDECPWEHRNGPDGLKSEVSFITQYFSNLRHISLSKKIPKFYCTIVSHIECAGAKITYVSELWSKSPLNRPSKSMSTWAKFSLILLCGFPRRQRPPLAASVSRASEQFDIWCSKRGWLTFYLYQHRLSARAFKIQTEKSKHLKTSFSTGNLGFWCNLALGRETAMNLAYIVIVGISANPII